MKILAIESSSNVASVAVLEDDIIKSEFTVNNKLTHSETLLPMIRDMEKISGVKLSDCDAVAVSKGPGSFTGLRIGAATAKGLCLAWNKPIIRVSTLMAMAANLIEDAETIKKSFCISDSPSCECNRAYICPIMDARRGQVYGAVYDKELSAVIGDGAYDLIEYLDELISKTDYENAEYIFIGDGVPVHKNTISGKLSGKAVFASSHVSTQHASSVALIGNEILKIHKLIMENEAKASDYKTDIKALVIDSDDFVPDYFRKTQAERELSEGILEDPGLHSLKKIGRGETERKH